jgi:hypothetical protein
MALITMNAIYGVDSLVADATIRVDSAASRLSEFSPVFQGRVKALEKNAASRSDD